MRDPKRIERIMHVLERLWKQYPDQRFGQLLENYVFPNAITTLGVKTALTWAQEDDDTFRRIITEINFSHPKTFLRNETKEEKS